MSDYANAGKPLGHAEIAAALCIDLAAMRQAVREGTAGAADAA